MAKKNYLNELPKLGGAAVMTIAVAAALATPVSASEVEGAPVDAAPAAPAPVAESTPAPAPVIVTPTEVPAVNAEISQDNSAAADDNAATDADNQTIIQENNATAGSNEAASNGALSAPETPSIPDAPTAPEVPNTDGMNTAEKNEAVGGYNDQVGDYNESVDDYNNAADDYNSKVDDYNNAADAFNQQEQDRFQQEDQEYQDYLDEKKAHEDAQKEHTDEVERLESEHNAEQDRKEAAHEAEEDRKEAEHNAQQDQAAADDLAAQQAEYDRLKAEAEAAHKAQQDQAAAEDLAAQEKEYNENKAQAETEHNAQQAALKEAHEKEQAALKEAHEKEQAALKEAHDKEQAALKEAHDKAQKELYDQAQAALKEAHDKEQLELYEKEQAALKEAHDKEQAVLKEAHDKEQAALKEAHDKEQKALEDAYIQKKIAYETQVKTEEKIYNDVDIYNNGDPEDPSKPGIIEENKQIDADNQALKNELDSAAVESINKVGQINAGVTVSQAVLDTLNTYDNLIATQLELQSRGAALDADERRDDELSSETYGAYLAEVQKYNEDVKAYNNAAKAYNDAVQTYNAAVQNYNDTKPAGPSSPTTGSGTQQGSANIDWGNVSFDHNHDRIPGDHLTHMDVKYSAAASKEVTVQKDENGNDIVEYSDKVTQYTVTGVYKDENSTNGGYSLYYSNDGWVTKIQQDLKEDLPNNEFGNTSWNHTGQNLNPVTGEISFYVTLTDSNGKTHGITVNMNAGSVYAEGSYYKAEANDFLKNYVGKDGKRLETVTIDNVEYYDISGESVFLISALTCDGMSKNGWGNNVTLTAHGLDLILNMQTMIELHQSANAQKINYLGYELGKPAQAIKIQRETYEALYGTFTREEFKSEEFKPEEFKPGEFKPEEFQPEEFKPEEFKPEEFKPEEFQYPDFVPKDYVRETFQYDDFSPTEYQKTQYERTKYERTKYQRQEFVAPEYDGPDAPTSEVAPPTNPIVVEHLNHIDTLQKLDELLYFVDPAPEAPDPIVIPRQNPTRPEIALKNKLVIEDEKIPLAKAPKTGDLSGIWAVISGLSLGGVTLLNRKRKEEA